MKDLITTYNQTGTLHHAYVIFGDCTKSRTALEHFLHGEVGITLSGNPDVWSESFETFGITEARHLKARMSTTVAKGGRRIVIVSFAKITLEAQHALLKVLEEPSAQTHIFLLAPPSQVLLPTLLSRVMILSRPSEVGEVAPEMVRDFLKAYPHERLAMIEEITKEKDTLAAIAFINALEEMLTADGSYTLDAKKRTSLATLATARGYLSLQGTSVKGVLEQVALVV